MRMAVQMALSGSASPSLRCSPASSGFGLAEVRAVKSGLGSIPSLPCILCANLLVGSAQEQLSEGSRAVPPGPEGLVAWAEGGWLDTTGGKRCIINESGSGDRACRHPSKLY